MTNQEFNNLKPTLYRLTSVQVGRLLGRFNKGVKKKTSKAGRAVRRRLLAEARKRRWPHKLTQRGSAKS